MPVNDVLIRAQELGGRWTVLGSDSSRGITIEDLSADADTWGPRACSFTLRRNTRVPWPDIGAFAPIEIESQGLPVWSGRVKGTPTTDGSDRRITVNGEGWQYHLDDDVYQKTYLHTSLTDFIDSRGLPGAVLGNFIQAGTITVGDAAITIGFPNGAILPGTNYTGVTLDFGPALAKRIIVNWESSNNAAMLFLARASDTPDGGTSVTFANDAFSFLINTGASGSTTGDFSTARRYVNLFLFNSPGFTAAAEIWFRIRLANIAQDTTYQSTGGSSTLPASTIIADALSKATLLLSTSTAKITTTTFNIPDFVMSKRTTPRDVINAVNAFHNYQSRVGVDKALEYRAQPANASIQVDSRSQFDEASAGDASQIYSSAIVSYTAADGSAGNMARTQPATSYTLSSIQPTNPGAEVNTTGWTSIIGTFTRTTVAGEFSAGVGAFKIAIGGANQYGAVMTSAWTGGTFVAGNTYRLTFDLRADTGVFWGLTITVGDQTVAVATGTGTGAYLSGALDWVQPSATSPLLTFAGSLATAAANYYIDNLVVLESAPTVVNRRGFRRTYLLDTNMSLTPQAAQQIGDVFLTAHKTTPLKGSLVVTGYGTAGKTPSGASMTPAELLTCTGDLVRFSHLIDPDTGAIGREGRIAAVSWDALSNTSTLEIDSQSQNFEAFIARLGIITGQVR